MIHQRLSQKMGDTLGGYNMDVAGEPFFVRSLDEIVLQIAHWSNLVNRFAQHRHGTRWPAFCLRFASSKGTGLVGRDGSRG